MKEVILLILILGIIAFAYYLSQAQISVGLIPVKIVKYHLTNGKCLAFPEKAEIYVNGEKKETDDAGYLLLKFENGKNYTLEYKGCLAQQQKTIHVENNKASYEKVYIQENGLDWKENVTEDKIEININCC
ncbi:MAG: hypothetical protein QW735_00655 [archaeon]